MKITSEQYNELPEWMKGNFQKDEGADTYSAKSDDQGSEDVTGLKNKNSELLGKIKQLQSELSDKDNQYSSLNDQVTDLQNKLNNGGKEDFEAKFNSLSKKYEELEGKHTDTIKAMESKELSLTANKIAAGLTSNKYKQEMLAKEIMPRLAFKDDKVQVLDNEGNLTVDSLDELASSYANNERYAFLIDGGNASGGNAPGNSGSGKQVPTWDQLSTSEKKQLKFDDPETYDLVLENHRANKEQ